MVSGVLVSCMCVCVVCVCGVVRACVCVYPFTLTSFVLWGLTSQICGYNFFNLLTITSTNKIL